MQRIERKIIKAEKIEQKQKIALARGIEKDSDEEEEYKSSNSESIDEFEQ